ncbi:hypothetical protein [Erythrobacter sp. CCH5-A1]|jgi:hypothetical protein|uniref:hypothetical protein n=1 Tax=Erythrobacter sp. CCH5-A1 TaxID=1768792 RepID=UPI0008310909|nr:hypothetical protein [Erythrobacter sp. CCH5-A1]
MPVNETAYAKINLALLAAAVLASCAVAEESGPITSDDQACERVMEVLVANQVYRAEQMQNCEISLEDRHPGYYVGRVNAYCHEPICGSVNLGWYAVEAKTGKVLKYDMAEQFLGKPFPRQGK